MTGVAHHINEMKRQHEVAVHVQVERERLFYISYDLISMYDILE